MATMVSCLREVLGLSKGSQPQWEGAVLGYAINYLTRQAWRVRKEMDLDDLLQDAYLLFMKLQDSYKGHSPAEFMALWKTALHNRLLNKAMCCNSRGRRRTLSLADSQECAKLDANMQQLEWRMHEQEAPPPVKRLLKAVEKRQRRLRPRKLSYGREKTNEYLCRLAGVPASTSLRSLLDSWLVASQK